MHRHSLLFSAGLLASPLAFSLDAREITARPDVPRRAEVARLRAHFDSVDAELRLATALHLTPSQRNARATLIGWLREYRDAGEFPRNDRFPRATPFFRDSYGALCAMAYLIQRSGREDIIDRVAVTRNNAFIAELANDAELATWLDSVGFSVAEAARVQPEYEGTVETYVAMYDSAWSRRDSSTINQLLAQEYQYFTSRGGKPLGRRLWQC
jgi:hypothetical protein